MSTKGGETYACELSQEEPKIVYAGPGTAHALINKSNQLAVIVSYGSEQHNPNEEDTFGQMAYENYEGAEWKR
jgi:dTDP-4-dehydrorhamnose 3,5-epimerase-like enzyme